MSYEWEERWFPIDNVGEEWMPRTERECDDLIADYARPDHWIHEEHNSDLTYAVGKRGERRQVGPWLPIEASRSSETS